MLTLLVALAALAPLACSGQLTHAPSTDVAPPAPAVTAAAAAVPTKASAFVTAQGTQLQLDAKPYRVVSVNAYQLATYWGVNPGCGAMLSDAALDAFFAALPAGTMVRIWGFQGSMGTNIHTRQRDWGPLDRVVAAAARHGDRLIVSLGNQAGDCDDGHWKDTAWYSGGYRTLYPGDGVTIASTSYWDWVQEVVTRYRDSTAIGMWELINEPEASDCAPGFSSWRCGGHLSCHNEGAAASALRNFYDVVGAEIKDLDPNHLVEAGAVGGPQCGWDGTDFSVVGASPGIDVLSYHDYESGWSLSPLLSRRLAEARALHKPLVVGELGVQAGNGSPSCPSIAARRDLIASKVKAELGAGVAGIFFWSWVPNAEVDACTYDLGTIDPAIQSLATGSAG